MRKFFFIFLSIFLLIVLFLGLIGLNLEYLLNKDFFKKRIQRYVSSLSGLEVDYERIHLNLYKLKVEVEELRAKGKDFELYLPKGRMFFSKRKLLKGNFYPSSVYLKNPYFFTRRVEEEKPLEIKRLYQYFYTLSPFTLLVNNGTFEYHFEEGKGLKLRNINLFANDKVPQVLFTANATSNAFSSLEVKGRLNYRDEFLESELKIKKLDLTRLNLKDLAFLKRTEFDFSATVSLEKDVLNVGFTGQAPCLAFNKGDSAWVCGFFPGIFLGK